MLLGLCIASATGAVAGPLQVPLARPNVLIIMTDDQPIGTLQVMQETKSYFAEQGTNFTNSFANNPLCCPARAALMTGRYSHNNGVRENSDAHRLDTNSTLQRYLQDTGYHTAIFGKYLNRWHDDPPHFDTWGVITGPYEYFDTVWNIDGEPRFVEGYWTDALAERSVGFLEEIETTRDDQPWLLYITTPAPHAPHLAASAYADAEVPPWKANPAIPERNKSDKPPYVREEHAWTYEGKSVRARQLRTLMSVDDLVADVMETLTRLGEDNTLAFYLSDNGYLWGEHGLLGTVLSKGNPYKRSVKVPMLMRWPGRVLPGHVDRRLVGLVDVAPTVLAATGVEPDPAYPQDGRSLLDLWTRDFILNESWRRDDAPRLKTPNWASIRNRDYSYVEYRNDGRIIFREYYDLANDRYELRNLLGDRDRSNDPDVDELHDRLRAARRCTADSCP